MTNILQDKIGLGNLQPLPKGLNSSKGSRTVGGSKDTWDFVGDQPLNSTYKANLEQKQIELKAKIEKQIATYNAQNQAGGK